MARKKATEAGAAPVRRPRTQITYNGKTQTISAWARELGMKATTLYHRIKKLGWEIARAMTEPVRKYVRPVALAEAA